MRRTTLIVAFCCALAFAISTTSGSAAAERASADATAVRGVAVAITPVPVPPVVYPTGRCDVLAPGLPGLAPRSWPQTMIEIGRSVEGRPIWAEYWGPSDPVRTIVVVAQTHGNECSPTLVAARLRERPPDRVGIWLIPTINPDGYARYERRNANGVDLNRDGGNSSQQVETRALMDFIGSVRPSLTVYVHSPNGFLGAFPRGSTPVAGPACQKMAQATGLQCANNGAGTRGPRSQWFLWQGQQDVLPGSAGLLVELPAVAHGEVPAARPRPPTRSIAEVKGQVDAILEILDSLP